MDATGGVPVDLILLGMVAAFLVLRLRAILGRRTGFEGSPATQPRPAAATVIEGRAETLPAGRPLPETSSAVGQALARIEAADRGFSPAHFLQGAEAAFRMIVTAFAAGERDRLRPLLSDDTFAGFEAAIAAREAAGEVQRSEIREVEQAVVTEAALHDGVAQITVRFVSMQVSVVLARDRSVVTGVDGLTELVDLWTFERSVGAPGMKWRLARAVSG